MIRGFITRTEALDAVNDAGQAIRPCDVLPDKGRYREQIKPLYAAWLITFLDELRNFGWPDMPLDDNYTDRSGRSHDPMETALVFTTEISTRLDACGRDGRLCLAYYRDNRMPDDMRAHWYEFGNPRGNQRASVVSIHYMVKNALLYCSGRRKAISYKAWLAARRNRPKAVDVL